MKQNFFRHVLLSMLLLFSHSLFAQNPLYLADVSAEQTQQQWQREALTQIMQRVTGDANIMQRPELRSELNQAASYVKQFEAFRSDQGNRVRVLLDAQRIQSRLKALQIPIWGGQKPDMLFWVVEQTPSERQFIRSADDPRLQAFMVAMANESLAATLPVFDLDDLMTLSETDVWGAVWEPILLASSRYRVNEVVLLLLEPLASGEWQLTAIRRQANNSLRDELTASDAESALSNYAKLLKQQIVQQFAITLEPDFKQDVVIRVSGISDLAGLLNTERRLADILGVQDVRVISQQASFTDFRLSLQIKPEQLLTLLAVEPSLQQLNTFEMESMPALSAGAVSLSSPIAQFQLLKR